MQLSSVQTAKPSALDANGRLIIYAAPLMAGFRGAPLALSGGKPVRRLRPIQRRNWARRRAYGG